MKKTTILMLLALMASLCAGAQGYDTVQLPYRAVFTHGWTAEGGATIIDSNHATLATVGDRLVSPWFEADTGTVYIHLAYDMDEDQYFYTWDTILFNIIFERDNNGADTIPFWGIYNDACCFGSEGGLYRIVVEYVGNDTMPVLPLHTFAVFQYNMEVTLSGVPDTAYVGDTITVTIGVTLPNGDILDSSDYRQIILWELYEWAEGQFGWQGYGINLVPDYFYDNRIDEICDIMAHTDSSVTLVWKHPEHYQLSGEVYKLNAFNGFYAWESSLWRYDEGVYVLSRNGIPATLADDISILVSQAGITIEGVTGEQVTVYDMMGRLVASTTCCGVIRIPQTGVYLVRVGDRPARKVVVLR